MYIREYEETDLDAVLGLVIETFRPFYEQWPAMVGHDSILFEHQHGRWEQDYRDEVPTLHDPAAGKHLAVATDGDLILGCISWLPDSRPEHAEIHLIGVDRDRRRSGTGHALMEHAMTAMREDGIRFVGLGTGGDDFHAPARRLYEDLGFHPIPIVGYLRSL